MGLTELPLQPHLHDALVDLQPLVAEDFERLYAVASDPLVWEQHPNKNRYKREVFETFFRGAMDSKGALLALDSQSKEPIGSSRFYDLDGPRGSVCIGYTFLARRCWGTTYNRSMKTLMLDHAFRFVERVQFHVGAVNVRSQKAIERLGAWKIGEEERTYVGESPSQNFIYQIAKGDWQNRNSSKASSG